MNAMVMPQQLRPGTFTRILTRVAAEGNVRTDVALGRVARGLETDTKRRLSLNTHPYGTRSTASPGGPPALVSGTLRRSITHDPVRYVGGDTFETKVGTAVGFFPSYPVKTRHRKGNRKGPTPANLYGKYLETGLRNGATYPFLSTSFREYLPLAVQAVWRESFHGRWRG